MFPQPALAQTPPAARWSVDIDPGSCSLERLDGASSSSIFHVSTYAGSDTYRVAVTTDLATVRTTNDFTSITLIFGDDHKRFTQNGRVFPLKTSGKVVLVEGLDPSVAEALAASSGLRVEVRSAEIGPISLPNAANAVRTFQKCIDDQLIEWGADPAQFKPGGTRAIALTERDEWLTNGQLMKLIIPQTNVIDAVFKLSIATDGSISKCNAIDPERYRSIEKSACSMMMKQRLFSPARDPAGAPVVGAASHRIQLSRQPNNR
jgi:hypothetical protein